MTEDEAKTKWCPHARVLLRTVSQYPAVNREPAAPPPRSTLCIASQCMAWRWRLEFTPPPIPEPYNVQVLSVTTGPSKTDGYCGLAGAA